MDWLTTDLGYVKTPRVRAKIRHYFRKLDRDKHIDLGRDVVERELKRMGVIDSMSIEDIAAMFNHSKLDSFLGAVGAGEIDATQLAHKMLEEENERLKFKDATSLVNKRHMGTTSSDDSDIKIMGVGGLLANIAACCNPMPGDDITGYITRGRGVTVHRRDCSNILSLSEPERLIDVSWGTSDEERLYAVPVEIIAYNRSGLIRDISTVIADEKVNIAEVQVASRQEIATFHITMEISNNQQLTRILSKIGQIRSVVETYRCNSA